MTEAKRNFSGQLTAQDAADIVFKRYQRRRAVECETLRQVLDVIEGSALAGWENKDFKGELDHSIVVRLQALGYDVFFMPESNKATFGITTVSWEDK